MKRNALRKMGISVQSYQYISSTLLYRYSTILTNLDYSYFQKVSWNEKPDPRNPDTGWNSRTSTLIFPLTGKNAEIVPVNTIGYKMDSTCDASSWGNNAYSYTDISGLFTGNTLIDNKKFFYASVYCFVSEDFDGSWVHISAGGEAYGNFLNEYDFTKKGVWQKLNIHFKNKGGLSPVYLYWAKYNVTDFSNLKGYVIFAYPQYGTIVLDPRNPDSGWSTRTSTIEFPLTGENVDIVPYNSIGYKMDSTCNASTWDNNAYSYTNISDFFTGDTITKGNKVLHASAYCFVSSDFNGSWARISAEEKVSGNTLNQYDLAKKGTWQKLEIDFKCDSGIAPVFLYWSKYGVTDFSSLKGYIIFAYPEYYNNSNPENDDEYKLTKKTDGIRMIKSSLFSSEFNFSKFLLNGFLLRQDTTLPAECGAFLKKLGDNIFLTPRTSRWYYSWIIFKEYPLWKKIFGSGFDYLEIFRKEFGGVKYDYPHNPFISAFLYSGIIGGIAYIWFIFMVFYYYIKYYKYHIYYFICFLIIFYFSFFSVNTHFSVSIFAIFSIMPFLTRYIVEKEEKEKKTTIVDHVS